MPRGRGSEMIQRVSSRGPAPLRTSSSESDPLPHRPIPDRSPKLADRRSPRNTHSEPVNQKKLGTRIAGLESQLEQAQGELKILKDQLASAEAAKKEAQKELEKKTKKPAVLEPVDTRCSPSENQGSNKEIGQENESPDENQKETDVFEVPIETITLETQPCDQDELELKNKPVKISLESPEKPSFEHTLGTKNEEIASLKLKIKEKENELESFVQENTNLKHQLTEATLQISSANAQELKTNSKMNQLQQELEKSQKDKLQLKESLKEAEGAKHMLETEMKKLRVQTEQWRKAADAAAAVLAGGAEMNDGRRVSGRCGSMEKHYGGGVVEGYGGFVGSPGLGDDSDDGLGKRKGSGIRMFGDLWKKKGQK